MSNLSDEFIRKVVVFGGLLYQLSTNMEKMPEDVLPPEEIAELERFMESLDEDDTSSNDRYDQMTIELVREYSTDLVAAIRKEGAKSEDV